MKCCIWTLVGVAVLGAVGGCLFMFLAIFLFGLPTSGSAPRGGVATLFVWLSAPLGTFVDWLAKENIIAADNMFIGMALCTLYWALLGACVALAFYYVMRLTK